MKSRVLALSLLHILAVLSFPVSPASAQEIGFAEEFALADDRSEALKKLIPGTEQYYYYHCLHYQNLRQFDRVPPLLEAWVNRHGNSSFVKEIQHRQALLTYEQSPENSLEFIRRQLNLNFNHQRQVVDDQPDLISSLDQNLISREQLTRQAMQRSANTDSFEDASLGWLAEQRLDPVRRRHLLERLTHPDIAALPDMIVADLAEKGSRGFGSLAIHRLLTREQLDECIRLRRAFLTESNFVFVYLTKLHPNPDVDWRNEDEPYAAYLEELWGFVEQLPPSFNSLKTHVLYHRLVHDRSMGVYDADRFMAYLQLPKQAGYANPDYLQDERNRRHLANLGSDYQQQTRLPIVGNDEPLVRSYLHHFFVDAANYNNYARFVRDTYLKAQFAETKIVNGIGDQEDWYSMLSPASLQALRDRVDIEFAYTNPDYLKANDPVQLDLAIKNVDNLIVKVFEINTQNFYRQSLQEISTDINLDGLVSKDERRFEYGDPALRRVSRHFEFPELNRAGVYVIDFIGNGKSSRVVIRKGKFRHLVTTTLAGQQFTVLDEKNQPIDDAVIWMGGREYKAADDGTVSVPFSNQPGRTPIVVSHDGVSSLDFFQHQGENYGLQAAFYVDRESLIKRKEATVLIRSGLTLNGNPISVDMLENVRLVVTSTDLDGISTTREIADFELFDGKESEFLFQIPERLSNISFQLLAKIERVTQGDKIDLAQAQTFTISQIDRAAYTEDVHFRALNDGYFIELLGKTGEPIVGRALQLSLKHKDFRFAIQTTLKTDALGRVSLGKLEDITNFQVVSPQGVNQSFVIPSDEYTYYKNVHAKAGDAIQLPYLGNSDEATRAEFSLFEIRGNTIVSDRFDAVSLNNGMILISDLPAGDYDLNIKLENQRVRLRLSDGESNLGHVLGSYRQLEMRMDTPFHVVGASRNEEHLEIETLNTAPGARLHVFGTSFVPPFSAFQQFGQIGDAEPYTMFAPAAKTFYVAGRKIGDEYQYILDRRFARKFPGNTLERPSLLLNPWAVRSTDTNRQDAQGGDEFARAADGEAGSRSQDQQQRGPAGSPNDFSNLNFLANASLVEANLVPDEDGKIQIPLELLDNYSEIRIVAIDSQGVCSRDVFLDELDREKRDLRLADGLPPDEHYTQQKLVTRLDEGDLLTIDDIASTRFQSYSTLADAYRLYLTLSSNQQLAEFSFILDWHEKSLEEKVTLYSKYACHELTFFVMKKDPAFFQDVVAPYLANKKAKTYLDSWLLDADLSAYRDPWRHNRLNVVERILLSRRIAAEQQPTQRHIGELYELSPTTRDAFNRLFQFAVKGNSLDVNDTLGFETAQGLIESERKYSEQRSSGQGWGSESGLNGQLGGGGGGAAGGAGGAPVTGYGNSPADRSGNGDRGGVALVVPSLSDAPSEAVDVLSNSLELSRGLDGYRGRYKENAEANLARLQAGRELRSELNQLYRKLDTTQEWAENNYYKLPIEQQLANLVDVNRFWLDYSRHDPNLPFFSPNFPEAAGNFTEMMFALAVLDLPVEQTEHESEFTERSMKVTAQGPMLAFHEEIRRVRWDADVTPVLVSQNFFRVGDRYYQQGGERFDKFVTDEFLTHTAYGCQVVVTNPTSTRQKIDVLTQIPEGAMEISGSKTTNSLSINLEPYHTQSMEFFFYFPADGQYEQYPVHVAKDEELVAFAEPMNFNVVNELTNIDRESWAYVSQFGTGDEVIEYLESHNLLETELAKIAFRMNDQDYFKRVTDLIGNHHAFDYTLWSYGIKHNDVDTIREVLQYADGFVNQCGAHIDSPVLTVDPVLRHMYQHLEYRPLVNARAHQLGPERRILNDRFYEQYQRLMRALSYYGELNDEALMAVTYYLLLQDRVEESIKFFGRINPDRLETRIQYDYFAAYLDMFSDEPTIARQTAERYSGYSVDRWRSAFQAILAQLDEIEGNDVTIVDDESRDQSQTKLADEMPAFDFNVESNRIRLNYDNLTQVRVNYYVMDIELLFSRNPFVQQYSGQFAFIQPNRSQLVELESGKDVHEFELPEDLRSSNVLVELTGAGLTKTQAYYSNSLDVQTQESYGMLRVTHETSNRPVPKTYVKTYARMKDGTIRFYKDGYTDLRGRFDYGSLSTNELDFVDRFSVLILSEEHGAVVREVKPPQQ